MRKLRVVKEDTTAERSIVTTVVIKFKITFFELMLLLNAKISDS